MRLITVLTILLCLLAAIPLTGKAYAGGMETTGGEEEIQPVENETAASADQEVRGKVVWGILGFLAALFITAL